MQWRKLREVISCEFLLLSIANIIFRKSCYESLKYMLEGKPCPVHKIRNFFCFYCTTLNLYLFFNMSINVLNTFKKKLHLVKFPLHESLYFSSTVILKNRSFISYKSEIFYALTYKNHH